MHSLWLDAAAGPKPVRTGRLHGSRFSADGKVLEGPVVKDLAGG